MTAPKLEPCPPLTEAELLALSEAGVAWCTEDTFARIIAMARATPAPAAGAELLAAMVEAERQISGGATVLLVNASVIRTWTAHTTAQAARVEALEAENARLSALLNTPELHDFASAVVLEAAHQRERWGADHDTGKAPEDWFWLLGYLGGKALHAAKVGDADKAMHHTISAAAALTNWHAALLGADASMRPGIGPGSNVFPAAAALKETRHG